MQMENQKDVKETIPGLRFYPTEDELVSFYLHNKLEEKRLHDLSRVIPVINIYELEPWQLPGSNSVIFCYNYIFFHF